MNYLPLVAASFAGWLATACGEEAKMRGQSSFQSSAQVTDKQNNSGHGHRDGSDSAKKDVKYLFQDFSLSLETAQVSEGIDLLIVIDNSLSMQTSINKMMTAVKKLFHSQNIIHRNFDVTVTTSTANFGATYAYYIEQNGHLVETKNTPTEGIYRAKMNLSLSDVHTFSVTPTMSNNQVDEVLEKISSTIHSFGTDGSEIEQSLCKALHLVKSRPERSKPIGLFVLTNENENLSECPNYVDQTVTVSEVDGLVSCDPAAETCTRTVSGISFQGYQYSLETTYYKSSTNDGVTGRYLETDTYYVNDCANYPGVCEGEANDPCSAAQISYLQSTFGNDYVSCSRVSHKINNYNAAIASDVDICNSPFEDNGKRWSNFSDYALNVFNSKYKAGTCARTYLSYLKPGRIRANIYSGETPTYMLTGTAERELASKFVAELQQVSGNQTFFIAGIRDQLLDNDQNCENNGIHFSYGSMFAKIADLLGGNAALISLCQDTFDSALNQMNQYINNVSNNLNFLLREEPLPNFEVVTFSFIAPNGSAIKIPAIDVKIVGQQISLPEKYKTSFPADTVLKGTYKYTDDL